MSSAGPDPVASLLSQKVARLKVINDEDPKAIQALSRQYRPDALEKIQARLRQQLYEISSVLPVRPPSEPWLVDPTSFIRTQHIGEGSPSLAVQAPRNPRLLMAKLEAFRAFDQKRRQKQEAERAEQDAADAKREKERIAKLEFETRKRAVRQSFLRALFEHAEKFRSVAKEENRQLRSLANQAQGWIIAKERYHSA
ncbi:hypothetical protein BVRB_023700, partial [Beta vulgaris subsp. vulgaris]